jgi:tetratricopeptide (TPR) repeat protein
MNTYKVLFVIVLCLLSTSCASETNDPDEQLRKSDRVNLPPEERNEAGVTDWDTAIRVASDAIGRNPNDIQAYHDRAVAWHSKGNYDKAISDYSEVLNRDATNQEAFAQRGKAWYDKERYDRAIPDLNEAIRGNPNDSELYHLRGFSEADVGHYDAAIADLTESLRLKPTAYAFNERGRVWTKKGNSDKAVADFNEAIRYDNAYWLAYLNRGQIYKTMKKYKNAFDDFGTALRLSPDSPEAKEAVAWLLATCRDQKYRDGKRSVELATQACVMTGWKQFRTLGTLAAAYAECGDFEAAVRWEQKSLDAIPKFDKHYQPSLERLDLYKSGTPYRE